MTAGPIQSVAPMSRSLGELICTPGLGQGNPSTAAGILSCLDGIAIVAAQSAAPSCNLRYDSGNPSDWRDVLRLLYAGANPFPDGRRDCNSAARRSLVDNWGLLFEWIMQWKRRLHATEARLSPGRPVRDGGHVPQSARAPQFPCQSEYLL